MKPKVCRLIGAAAAAGALAALTGCGGDGGSTPPSPVLSLLSQPVGPGGSVVAQQTGMEPAGSAAPPIVTVGGGAVSSLSLASGQQVSVVVNGGTGASDILVGAGSSGFYDVNVAATAEHSGTGQYPISLTFPNLPTAGTTLTIVSRDGAGVLSQPVTININSTSSSAGSPPPPAFT